MKLLIIDDEPIFRRGLTNVVETNQPFIQHIFQAGTAKEALAIASQERGLDVAFVDINLPDMNGLDLAKKIKAMHPAILITMISGYDDFNYARQAIQLQVFDYLLKPLAPSDINQLLLKIEEELRPVPHSNKTKDIPKLCLSAITTIEEQYANPELTLNSVANTLFVDPSYLSKQIKKHTGKTFNEYLTGIRITRAKELLQQPALPYSIQVIGEKVGYSNPHYFSRLFKQHTGQSPSEYKDNHL